MELSFRLNILALTRELLSKLRLVSTAIDCGAKGMKLVEKGPLGGTCPHRGCIPSKLLIGYADAAERAREAQRFGFETTARTPTPDAILRDTFLEHGNDGWISGVLVAVDDRDEGWFSPLKALVRKR